MAFIWSLDIKENWTVNKIINIADLFILNYKNYKYKLIKLFINICLMKFSMLKEKIQITSLITQSYSFALSNILKFLFLILLLELISSKAADKKTSLYNQINAIKNLPDDLETIFKILIVNK